MELNKITYEDVPEASHEAVHAARNAAQALEVARLQQITSIGDIVQERVEHVLAQGTEQEKSIILARVPYICQDIKEINKKFDVIMGRMDEVKKDLKEKDKENGERFVSREAFGPVQKVVYGLVGIILSGFIVSVLAYTFR